MHDAGDGNGWWGPAGAPAAAERAGSGREGSWDGGPRHDDGWSQGGGGSEDGDPSDTPPTLAAVASTPWDPAPRTSAGLEPVPPHQVTWRELTWEELVTEAERVGPDPRFDALSDAEVIEQLAVGAAQIDAALCRWLELLAEFTVRGVWADEGARTAGMWLSWRLGIAPSTAREHVRVALKLREFPATRDRFAAGTLSYSKVRAITRCGQPDAEDMLLAWADDATAAQLEQVARGFRRAEKARRDDAIAGEPNGQRCSVRSRSLGDGRRSLTITAPDEVIAAIEDDLQRLAEALLADRLDPEAASAGGTDGVGVGSSDPPPDGDRLGAAEHGAGLEGGAARQRVTSMDQVDALMTALAAAAAAGTVPDTSGLDRHTLVLHASVDDVTRAVSEGGIEAGGTSDAVPAADMLGLVPVTDEHRRIRGMDRTTLRRLACEAGVVLVVEEGDGTPLDVGRRRRSPTAAQRRALQRRDRGCTFPGCHATRHLHAHHVRHWADGGPTDLANLVLVCGFHHRFVHAADWHIEVRADGRHLFRPAADAAAVPRVGAAPGAPPGAVAASAPGSASAEALLPPDHVGGPYDLDTAVAVLQRIHRAARPETALAA